jgi:uncharacterized protein YbjQ (UPF0145 family)/predicted nucleic-acid-binding Zn-ribbon protein
MSQEKDRCPACNKPLSEKVVMLPESMIELLRIYAPQDSYVLCSKCGGSKLYSASTRFNIDDLSNQILTLQKNVPIVSAQSPMGWDYEAIKIVTAQSVIGTGILSEFSASISDLFGSNSPAFVGKIVQGEDLGFAQLVQKTIRMGGNAIIAVDIDYAELGGMKGMIMVCMTGTAVRIRNTEVLGKDRQDSIQSLMSKIAELDRLNSLFAEYRLFYAKYI